MKIVKKSLMIVITVIFSLSFMVNNVSASTFKITPISTTGSRFSRNGNTININANTNEYLYITYSRLPIDSNHNTQGQVSKSITDAGDNKPSSHSVSRITDSTKYLRLTIRDKGTIDSNIISDIYIMLEENDNTTNPSPEPEPQPQPEPVPESPDYTTILNTIVSRLDTNNTRINTVNTRLTTVTNSINTMNTQIKDTITTKTNEIKSSLTTVNNSINSVKSELQTTKRIERNQPHDYKNVLENNKTSVPNNKFTDDNTYFEQPNIINNESSMPDLPNVKKWENVDEPTELNKDETIEIDNELSTDEFFQDNELIKDEFTEDNFLKDSELLKDNEYNKEEFELDTEFLQDSFNQDNELNQDNFNNTEIYEQKNQFEKAPDLERTETNANLRWKSVNGVFQ